MAPTVETILIVGASHRSSSLALRDQICVDGMAAPGFLRLLAERGVPLAAVLSSPERVEVICRSTDPAATVQAITHALAERAGLKGDALIGQLYRLSGADAVRHCFAVAAGLDSLVMGDPHVLRQITAAHALVQGVSAALDRLLTFACETAKRVRAETGIAEGPVSIAAAAMARARHLHGDLARCQTLLIGTGDMGELVADSLRGAGVRRFTVTAPRVAQAEALAASLEGHVAPFGDLLPVLAAADIVVSSVSNRHHALTADLVRQALRRRRQSPIFIVDAGIPGDVEPAVNRLDNAFLYDLNDLEQMAMEGRASRERAARAAWAIITAAVATFLKGHEEGECAANPVLRALERSFAMAREDVLRQVGADARADHATRLLLEHLLRVPAETLQMLTAQPEAEQILRRLFRLEDGPTPAQTPKAQTPKAQAPKGAAP